MRRKICSKCGIEKEFFDFHKFIHSKDGRKSICKSCVLEQRKDGEEKIKNNKRNMIWRQKNPEKVKEYRKKEYVKNRDVILLRNKMWKEKNPKKLKKIMDSYREKNKEFLNIKKKDYREKNKERVLNLTRRWIKDNYERYQQKKNEYRKSEIGLKKKRDNYRKNKEKNNHIIAWRSILINTIKRIGTTKEGKTNEALGYSAKELKENIEYKFTEGMSWENWGEWHIDHIKPVSKFDKSEKITIINSLDNLQPLWAKDNLMKSNKFLN